MGKQFFKLTALLLSHVLVLNAAEQEGASTAAPPPAQASDESLVAIQQEIESLRKESQRLNAEEDSVINQLAQFDVEYQMKSHEIELLELKQQNMSQEIQVLQSQVSEQEKHLQLQKEYLSRRLVEAYKSGQLNYVKLLLRVSKSADLMRSYQYISYLAKDDSRRVHEYRQSIDDLAKTKLRLEQESRNLALLKQDLESAHVALLHSRQEKLKLLTAIQQQREVHLDALNELSRAAGQLQDFFSGSDSQKVPTSGPPLTPLTKFKGLLAWPVPGRVIRGFGQYKHPKFRTTTMSNGIEIAADEGTEVRAVHEGQVVFAEWFKGYGQCIIISHSDGYYTLYGHNSEILTQRGDQVARNQLIARTGSTGSLSGSSLYFEIRKKDQPVNPLEWLRRARVTTAK